MDTGVFDIPLKDFKSYRHSNLTAIDIFRSFLHYLKFQIDHEPISIRV